MSKDILERMKEIQDKTKPSKLRFTLGEWAEDCLKNNTPLNAETLAEWNSRPQRSPADKFVIQELLSELSEK